MKGIEKPRTRSSLLEGWVQHPSYVPSTCNSYEAQDLSKPQTTYTCDGLERIERETAPDGRCTEYRYGVAGGLQYYDVLDPNRHRTQFRYDAYGRLSHLLSISAGPIIRRL